MKIVKKFQPKIVIFTAVKNRCMLHERVFLMSPALAILHRFEPRLIALSGSTNTLIQFVGS